MLLTSVPVLFPTSDTESTKMARFGDRTKKRIDLNTNRPQFQFFAVKKKNWPVYVLLFHLAVNSAGGAAGCEREGPCEVDNYCSLQRNVCRSCGDIASHYCQNRTIILERFPACDAYCYRLKFETATAELIAKEAVVKKQTDVISQLNRTVTSIDPACGKGLDQIHYALLILCAVFMTLVCVAIWMLIRLRQRKASTCRRSPGAEMTAEMSVLLRTQTTVSDPLATPTLPRADEEGYGTGHSGNSTPLAVRARTPPPDAEGQSSAIQPRPHVVTENGQNVHSPTTEDDRPPAFAVLS